MIPTPIAWTLLALVILCLGAAIWLSHRHPQGPYPWQEVPPTEERPTLPPAFKPVKPRAVKDQLAWRKVHPREAEAIARHARQLHYHEQEEAELREASR